MRIWRCTVCGWLHEGENPPDRCPRCGAPAEKFELVEPLEYAGLMQEDEVADAVEVKEMTAEDKKRIEPALFSISCGLYIVGSVKDGRPNAQVCNTVFQLTSAPMRIALGIYKNNLTKYKSIKPPTGRFVTWPSFRCVFAARRPWPGSPYTDSSFFRGAG